MKNYLGHLLSYRGCDHVHDRYHSKAFLSGKVGWISSYKPSSIGVTYSSSCLLWSVPEHWVGLSLSSSSRGGFLVPLVDYNLGGVFLFTQMNSVIGDDLVVQISEGAWLELTLQSCPSMSHTHRWCVQNYDDIDHVYSCLCCAVSIPSEELGWGQLLESPQRSYFSQHLAMCNEGASVINFPLA